MAGLDARTPGGDAPSDCRPADIQFSRSSRRIDSVTAPLPQPDFSASGKALPAGRARWWRGGDHRVYRWRAGGCRHGVPRTSCPRARRGDGDDTTGSDCTDRSGHRVPTRECGGAGTMTPGGHTRARRRFGRSLGQPAIGRRWRFDIGDRRRPRLNVSQSTTTLI